MGVAAEAITNYWESHATEATEKKLLFLQGLADSGTVIHAAELAGINRRTAYLWRSMDPEFRAQWDEVLENTTDNVERSLYNQAVSEKNVVATIFYLKANRAKYRDRVQLDIPAIQRQVEERLEQYRLQLALPPASTKDIINSVLGFTGGDTSQPVAAPTTNDNHHD
jgi:hypothetical protein